MKILSPWATAVCAWAVTSAAIRPVDLESDGPVKGPIHPRRMNSDVTLLPSSLRRTVSTLPLAPATAVFLGIRRRIAKFLRNRLKFDFYAFIGK